MMMAKFDNQNFETQLMKYNNIIEELKRYQNMLLEQYALLDTQEFQQKQNILNQIENSITSIKYLIDSLEDISNDGKQILSIYNDTELELNRLVNNLNSNIDSKQNEKSTINKVHENVISHINFKNLRFNHYVPHVFSKNILTEDWLIDLIQKIKI